MQDAEWKIPIHFGVKRSKVQVTTGLRHYFGSDTITCQWVVFNIQLSYLMHRCRMVRQRYLYLFGVKRLKVNVTSELYQRYGPYTNLSSFQCTYFIFVEDALQTYRKRWSKKEGVGVHALNDWKNEFLRIIDIRIDNFTKHPHLFKQPSSRSVKSLKKKMEKLHRKYRYVFAPADKAANNVIIIWKKTLRKGFEGWIKFYEYIRTCSVDERPTSCASYQYSHENRCQNW